MVERKNKPQNIDKQTHQSLGRGLRVLQAVVDAGGSATLADIVHRTDLARSTAHYLMQALVSFGYLRQPRDGHAYFLGLRVFRLAGRALTSDQIAAVAKPVLAELCRQTGESVALGMYLANEVTLVATQDSDGPIRVVQNIGAKRPVHCTGLGKVLLAWIPTEERTKIIERITFEKLTDKSIGSRAEFERELRRVRSAGYAMDDEELVLGLRCVAAPIFNDGGVAAYGLSVVGPKHRMTHQKLKTCRPIVLECARKLEQLGLAS